MSAALHIPARKKPPHGEPCNNCGRCCAAELCPLASALFTTDTDDEGFAPQGVPGRCPALEPGDDGSFFCGLLRNPERYFPVRAFAVGGAQKLRDATAILIGAGHGCDAQIEGEPYNRKYHAGLRAWALKNNRAIRAAKEAWGFGHDGVMLMRRQDRGR